jgi:hypothetical protein
LLEDKVAEIFLNIQQKVETKDKKLGGRSS